MCFPFTPFDDSKAFLDPHRHRASRSARARCGLLEMRVRLVKVCRWLKASDVDSIDQGMKGPQKSHQFRKIIYSGPQEDRKVSPY